jgi:hypothetical protein
MAKQQMAEQQPGDWQYCNCEGSHRPGCCNDRPGGLPPLDDSPDNESEACAARTETSADRKLAEIRALMTAFDWETDDHQYALEAIDRIVTDFASDDDEAG